MVNTIDQKFRVKEKTDEQGNIQVYEIQKFRNPFIGFARWKDYEKRFDSGPDGPYYEAKFFAYKDFGEAEKNCRLLNQGKGNEVTPSKTIKFNNPKGKVSRVL